MTNLVYLYQGDTKSNILPLFYKKKVDFLLILLKLLWKNDT